MSSYYKEGQLPRYRSNSAGSRHSMDDRRLYTTKEVEAQRLTLDFEDYEAYDEPTLRPVFTSQSAYYKTHSRPLIEYIRNEWMSNPKYGQVYSNGEDRPNKFRMFLSWLAAPRVRRYILGYTLIGLCIWGAWHSFLRPLINEHTALARSLNVKLKSGKGWFGTNARPEFIDMIHLKTLDSKLIPNDKTHERGSGKRLVFVGDVHGCKDEREFPDSPV
jgi:hypothetical protein